MKKIKVGVLGAYRGTGMINYCKVADNAELVAICDKYVPALEKQKELCGTDSITYYTSFDELYKLWFDAIHLPPEVMDLVSESLILYTLSRIGSRKLGGERREKSTPSSANGSLIKAYIDKNFANPMLSCESIASYFCYNKKYISTLFKKSFQIGIAEYINVVRINSACLLMKERGQSVGEIASAVVFNDPLYFSKVFKRRTGRSPKQFMKEVQL